MLIFLPLPLGRIAAVQLRISCRRAPQYAFISKNSSYIGITPRHLGTVGDGSPALLFLTRILCSNGIQKPGVVRGNTLNLCAPRAVGNVLAYMELVRRERHLTRNLNGERFHARRVIDHINSLAGVLHAEIVLVAPEADTAALVRLALLTVEECSSEDGRINEAGRHGIALESNLRRGSQGAVVLAVVAFFQPRVELRVQFAQRVDALQRNLGKEGIHRMVETLLLALALRIPRPRVEKPDTHQAAGTFHPMRTILRSVVEVKAAWRSILRR